MSELEQARKDVNRIDAEMARLFEERMRAVSRIAAYKKENGLPVRDPVREAAMIARNRTLIGDQSVEADYVEFLQSRGASLIMIAKGQRSAAVADSCKRYGGSYLGTMGGTAALFADENVESIECIDYPELGMEAVWKLRVKNLPAFILL